MQQITCSRCKHEWNYKGTAWWITCPHCRKIIKNPQRVKAIEV